MKLPKSLLKEFVKVTSNTTKTKTETTVYGSIVKDGDSTYVKLDGSDNLTPVSTTTDAQSGERVTVMIKNHTATVTGNISSPAARTDDVQQLDANKLDVSSAEITYATISSLNATNAKVDNLEADHGDFKTLTTDNFDAVNASIDNLEATQGEFETLTTENFNAVNASIENLTADHGEFETLTTEKFEAVDAKINNIVAGDLDVVYANIDFSNIGKAAMEYFYSQSGLIENVVVSDGTITGNLVGVTIKGDLIEGNTVVADKLVILGQNGLYYKLNTDGVKIEAEQTEYNSLNGTNILAKSITATKINVDDLVAFDATIGGFNISADSIYSAVKDSLGNTTRGIYLGKDGQFAFGDANNFLRYYVASDGSYKFDISLRGNDIGTSIDDASKTATNFLGFDSTNGLQVGDKTGGVWSGFRAKITSTAFEILDATGTALASYGAKLIELGKNATDAIIKLCGGKGQIEYITDTDTSDNYLQISADKLRFKSESMTSLYSVETTSSGQVNRSAVNVAPQSVYAYSGSSNLSIDPEKIDITTPGNITINSASVQDSYGQFLSISEGSSGNWSYRKLSNGDVELWGSYTVSGVSCSTSFGSSLYRSNALTMPAFPFSIYQPNLTASYESNGYGAFLWATSTTTETSPPSYYLVRAESGTITSGKINFHVIGKWME